MRAMRLPVRTRREAMNRKATLPPYMNHDYFYLAAACYANSS